MRSLRVLRDNRAYIGIAAGIFLLGWLLGALFSQQMLSVVAESIKHMQGVAEAVKQRNSPLYTSLVIFLNNLKAAALLTVFGIPFCVIDGYALFVNGLTVGVVMNLNHAASWKLVLFGLAPHGIFELSAVFISGAFGLKFGRVLLVPLRGMTRWNSFRFVSRELWSVSWIVLLLLLVAAAVEGMVTPALLHAFVQK